MVGAASGATMGVGAVTKVPGIKVGCGKAKPGDGVGTTGDGVAADENAAVGLFAGCASALGPAGAGG